MTVSTLLVSFLLSLPICSLGKGTVGMFVCLGWERRKSKGWRRVHQSLPCLTPPPGVQARRAGFGRDYPGGSQPGSSIECLGSFCFVLFFNSDALTSPPEISVLLF